jgi:predicted enzyme related to lactoylglutathione lyase
MFAGETAAKAFHSIFRSVLTPGHTFPCAGAPFRILSGHKKQTLGEVSVTKSAKSRIMLTLAIAFMFVANAHAGVTLAAARIGAVDVEGVAKFYQAAFGMQEIMRLDMPGIKEIMLNFGDTVEAAKANPNPWIVIMGRDSNDVKEVPHLVLYVTDVKATVAAVKAAGGTVEGEPRPFGDAGMIVGFAVDPAGNRMELIQQKAK